MSVKQKKLKCQSNDAYYQQREGKNVHRGIQKREIIRAFQADREKNKIEFRNRYSKQFEESFADRI